jgi:hypothetical protein
MMIENLNRLRVVLAAAAGGVLLAVGMPMVAAVSPAEAAFPGQNGKIAFTSNRDGDQEIYTMNTNGQGIDRLTNDPKQDTEPDWQPLSPPPNPTPPNPTPPNPTPPNNDTTPPKVINTSPKANAKAVAPTVNIKATFSEDMLASTINKSTFKLSKKGSTTKVSAAVGYDAATDKATLNPTEALRKGATYKGLVTSGAKDAAGNPLGQNTAKTGLQQKRWVFAVKK